MKFYEITYLIVPDLTAEETAGFHEKIKKLIEENKGKIGGEQTPTKKTLAYPVKKRTEGFLASIDFETEKEAAKKISEDMRKKEEVLRYLIISKETSKKSEEEPKRRRRSLKPEKAKLKEIDDKLDEIV